MKTIEPGSEQNDDDRAQSEKVWRRQEEVNAAAQRHCELVHSWAEFQSSHDKNYTSQEPGLARNVSSLPHIKTVGIADDNASAAVRAPVNF
jgi:hypothetical protein